MPSWSLGPKRPQAFPGGPLRSRGRESKEGQWSGAIVLKTASISFVLSVMKT